MFIAQNMPMILSHRRHKTDGVLKGQTPIAVSELVGHVGFLTSQDLTVLESLKRTNRSIAVRLLLE
jgi:hypothetical protein